MILADNFIQRFRAQAISQRTRRFGFEASGLEQVCHAERCSAPEARLPALA
jgi:hypothetical protein